MTQRLKLLLILFVFCSLVFLSGTSSAQEYTITDQELMTLEQNLNKQQITINQLQNILATSNLTSDELKTQLLIVQEALKESRLEIESLKQDLVSSQNSLQKANQLLDQYEREVKAETNKLKLQRNLALMAVLAVAVAK